jgi:signal transduction histidine kinase
MVSIVSLSCDLTCLVAAVHTPSMTTTTTATITSNAIKFTDEGSVSVEVTVDAALRELRICVTDTGRGIPEEFRDLIFHTMGLTTTIDFIGGSGLGLAICK